jgi:predicted Zn finger-like uncharacterized protein
MPIDVTCKACGTKFRVDDKYAGKKGKCKSCGQVVTVASAVASASSSAPRSKPKAPSTATKKAAPLDAFAGGQSDWDRLLGSVEDSAPAGDVAPVVAPQYAQYTPPAPQRGGASTPYQDPNAVFSAPAAAPTVPRMSSYTAPPRQTSEGGGTIVATLIKIVCAVMPLLAGGTLVSAMAGVELVAALFLIVTVLMLVVVVLTANIWLVVLAFMDEVMHGILILLFGPYALFYALNNSDRTGGILMMWGSSILSGLLLWLALNML